MPVIAKFSWAQVRFTQNILVFTGTNADYSYCLKGDPAST